MSKTKNELVVEELWLRYFNDSLLEKGLITKEQWLKMNTKIIGRTSKLQKRKHGGNHERN